jgi:competence protein ComGF
MDRIFKIRVRASSLIEVITALIIISIIFTIAIMVYLNVQRSGFSSRRLTGELLINEVLVKTLKDKRFDTTETNSDDITVYQDVTAHKTVAHLKVLTLEARDINGKLVAERKRLIYVPD